MARVSVGTSGWVGLGSRDFARRYDVVEFNWTFHEREDDVEQFKKVAADLKALRLQAVLKVSGVATHENRLRSPELWWPKLWAKYAIFHEAGVLGGLLWQLAPSHRCTDKALEELETLARKLPDTVLHIFEFRHSSWYERPAVLEILRRYRCCLAWIHITNEDGWCGDLASGWASRARTCNALYLRLFGTKQKAVGRYSDAFLREEVLPIVQDDPKTEAYVVFAQADVPDHAKADATAFIEVLGRAGSEANNRSTRWERNVLAATLGLGEGSVVEGVVQRLSHRTVFIDIGRSCRASLCANHARRVGLLDELQVGTALHGLVVQSIEFQAEWGHVGLTCHKASIGWGARDESKEGPEAAQHGGGASSKKLRWSRGAPSAAQDTGSSNSTEQGKTLPLEGDRDDGGTQPAPPVEAKVTKRWGPKQAAPHKDDLPAPELAEEEAAAPGAAEPAPDPTAVAEALLKLVDAPPRKELPPARRQAEENALARAEARKVNRWGERDPDGNSSIATDIPSVDGTSASGSLTIPSLDRGEAEKFVREEGSEKAEVEDDDVQSPMQAWMISMRKEAETKINKRNAETFGEDYDLSGWSFEDMMRRHEEMLANPDAFPIVKPSFEEALLDVCSGGDLIQAALLGRLRARSASPKRQAALESVGSTPEQANGGQSLSSLLSLPPPGAWGSQQAQQTWTWNAPGTPWQNVQAAQASYWQAAMSAHVRQQQLYQQAMLQQAMMQQASKVSRKGGRDAAR